MGVLLDIVSAAIIVGMIVLVILNLQVTVLESGYQNRTVQVLQGYADIAVKLLHEEVKTLSAWGTGQVFPDSSLAFTQVINLTDTVDVIIFRENDMLRIERNARGSLSPAEIAQIPLFLGELEFSRINNDMETGLPQNMHQMLRVRVKTEMIDFNNKGVNLAASAWRDIFLRHLEYAEQSLP